MLKVAPFIFDFLQLIILETIYYISIILIVEKIAFNKHFLI